MTYSLKKRGLYDPSNSDGFKLSRSKIDLFTECPRCFYLDRRFGLSRPDGPAFTLNVAVDHLLKKEFDLHRKKGEPHPIMRTYGVDAIPFEHESLDEWRENFVGIQHLHPETRMMITGAVDDIWIHPNGELAVVDYKATAKEKEVELEDTKWHNQYRRQMEVYQWLLRQKNFKVSDTGYFVYVNGKKDRKAFDAKLEFDVKVIPYKGNGDWIPVTLDKIKKCLDDDRIPKTTKECDFCGYIEELGGILKNSAGKGEKSKDKEKMDNNSLF